MSYSITISGHTANEHNAKVKEIAEDAWSRLAALHSEGETSPSLSGYSGDQTGSISLTTPLQSSTADTPAAELSAESATE